MSTASAKHCHCLSFHGSRVVCTSDDGFFVNSLGLTSVKAHPFTSVSPPVCYCPIISRLSTSLAVPQPRQSVRFSPPFLSEDRADRVCGNRITRSSAIADGPRVCPSAYPRAARAAAAKPCSGGRCASSAARHAGRLYNAVQHTVNCGGLVTWLRMW